MVKPLSRIFTCLLAKLSKGKMSNITDGNNSSKFLLRYPHCIPPASFFFLKIIFILVHLPSLYIKSYFVFKSRLNIIK